MVAVLTLLLVVGVSAFVVVRTNRRALNVEARLRDLEQR